MMRQFRLMTLSLVLAAVYPVCLHAAEPTEQQLIATLESTATLRQKDDACRQLKRIGTARSVPALVVLLLDDDLSHSARYALESMDSREAEQALESALDKTTSLTRTGIVQSLAASRAPGVASTMLKLLSDADPNVVSSAAAALGAMATPRHVGLLFAALVNSTDTARQRSLQDALLDSATRLSEQGKLGEAAGIYEKLLTPSTNPAVKAAAFRGKVLSSSSDAAIRLVTAALREENGPIRASALQLAHELKGPDATKALSDTLPSLTEPYMQAALIEALHQRGDDSAGPGLIAMAASMDAAVRVAALSALGDLADSSAVPTLARAAASSYEEEKKAARQALVNLRRGDVISALLQQLEVATPEIQRALVRVLTMRRDSDAVAKLLALAAKGTDSARTSALQALGQLTQPTDLPRLVGLLASARDAAARNEISAALLRSCTRLQSTGARIDTTSIVAAYSDGDAQTRIALLPVAAALPDTRLRNALRAALQSTDTATRNAAEKALCEARDFDLLPDLLALANNSTNQDLNVQAIRGCLRLASDRTNPDISLDRRVDALEKIMPLARQPAEKIALLSSLAETSGTKPLELALPLLDDTATSAEAVLAITKIAAATQATDAGAARNAIQKVLVVTSDPAQRAAATTILDKITSATGTMPLTAGR